MNTQLVPFFEGLQSEADIDKFVQDKREEDLYLEFKEKEHRRDGELSDGDKSAFSKAVSGFANADGGVLIFGVATTHSRDNPDHASKLKPITNAERLRAKLLDSILNTTQPPADGVRVRVIPGVSGDYVACLIPASDMAPHRAMLVNREYWRRTANGFRRMEHYELEDAFGRRLRPVLRVQLRLKPREDPDPHQEIHFFFLNQGRGVARHSGLHCTFGEGTVVVMGADALEDVSRLNEGRPGVSYYNRDGVIHPNGIRASLGMAVLRRDAKGTPLTIAALAWYAEDMVTRRETSITIEPDNVYVVS